MLKEPAVKRAVERYLDRKGYMKVDSCELHEQGMDLTFRHRRGGRYILVEAKGESGAKSEMENKLLRGIGQLASKFRFHRNYTFALAVPARWASRVKSKISLDTMKGLNLRVYLVDDSSRVTEVSRQNYNRELNAAMEKHERRGAVKRAA